MQQLDFNALGLKTPTKIAQMHTGSASTNYYIQNEDGEFLIKCIFSTQQKERLLTNLKRTEKCNNCPHFLFEKKLGKGYALVFKWIEGESYYLEKLPEKEFIHLIQSYLSFLTSINTEKTTQNILPAVQTLQLYEKIVAVAPHLRTIQKELKNIKEDLSYHPKMCVIHGDFHYKNILFKNNHLQSFLDVAELRHGCPTEDLMRLLITNAEQHHLIRKKYTLKLLEIMIKNTPYSKEDWLYGLDAFVLNKYLRLLKPNIRRYVMLSRCSILYSQIRSQIHSYFSKQ